MSCFSIIPSLQRRFFHLSNCYRAVFKPQEAESLFLDANVQTCLRQLVGFDPQIVFKRRPVPKLSSPRYVLMADTDLQQSLRRVNKRGRKILELVPYKAPFVDDKVDVLSKDTELQGYEKFNIVFTDISPGSIDLNRIIAVREPSGLLRRATREERHRMNQIYYPVECRSHVMPQMFMDEHLTPVLDRKDYLFVLDRACVQFEPDDPDFHRVLLRTFDHIVENKVYDVLRSNRYFGSLVFHLIINDNIDGLLQHFIDSEKISESALLVRLYYIIQNEHQAEFNKVAEEDISQLQFYIVKSSKLRPMLERSLDSYEEKCGAGQLRSSNS